MSIDTHAPINFLMILVNPDPLLRATPRLQLSFDLCRAYWKLRIQTFLEVEAWYSWIPKYNQCSLWRTKCRVVQKSIRQVSKYLLTAIKLPRGGTWPTVEPIAHNAFLNYNVQVIIKSAEFAPPHLGQNMTIFCTLFCPDDQCISFWWHCCAMLASKFGHSSYRFYNLDIGPIVFNVLDFHCLMLAEKIEIILVSLHKLWSY